MSKVQSVPFSAHFRLRSRFRLAGSGLALVAATTLVACQPAVPAVQAAAGTAGQPPVVAVATVLQSDLESTLMQIARVESAQRVELRARVAGPVQSVLFREGDLVQMGQPLFQIDPRTLDASVARAKAELKLARAREGLTGSEASRARRLHEDHAIATEEFDRRVAAYAEAQAQRAAAQASLQTAELEREFALIRAPISGRIGRAHVTPGNFVDAGADQRPLASIVAIYPLHVNFDVSDRAVIERLTEERALSGALAWKARILDGDDQHELTQAPVDFVDHSIAAATGTLRVRLRVDAPPSGLIPGQYVRVQLATGKREPTLLVPDNAIATDQGKRFVLVVGADKKVEYRAVSIGSSHQELRIVSSGLEAGEQVIVSGLMRIRPGMKVMPQLTADDPFEANATVSNPS